MFFKFYRHLQTSCCEEKTVVVFKTEGQSKLPAVPFLGFHCQPENSFLVVGTLDILVHLYI